MQDYIVPIIIGAIVLLAIIIFMCNYIKEIGRAHV